MLRTKYARGRFHGDADEVIETVTCVRLVIIFLRDTVLCSSRVRDVRCSSNENCLHECGS